MPWGFKSPRPYHDNNNVVNNVNLPPLFAVILFSLIHTVLPVVSSLLGAVCALESFDFEFLIEMTGHWQYFEECNEEDYWVLGRWPA